MILYRGTPVPETKVEKRSYLGVYFTNKLMVALEFAAGEGSTHGNSGFVQKYEIVRPRLFNFEGSEAERTVEFAEPDKKFVDSLIDAGYIGMRNREDVLLFDTSGVRLVERFSVRYDEADDKFEYKPIPR